MSSEYMSTGGTKIFCFSVTIATHISSLLDEAKEMITCRFAKALRDQSIPEEMIKSILDSVSQEKDVVKETFSNFQTPTSMEAFFKKHFTYVTPHTVNIGDSSFQYVSPIEVLRAVLSDRTLHKYLANKPAANRDVLSDVVDGESLNNDFFQQHPDAIK